MSKQRWYDGMPPVEAVAAHESQHPRPDGIRLNRINVDRINDAGDWTADEVKCDDWSYGEWICFHHKSNLQPYVAIVRLKVAEGKVVAALGFTAWHPLDRCSWGPACRYFPVGQDGLPIGYNAEATCR